MMAVPIENGPELRPGVPERLFEMPRVSRGYFTYDVSVDGRFLIMSSEELTEGALAPVTVVMNWTKMLEP